MTQETASNTVLTATRAIGATAQGKHNVQMYGVCRAGVVDDTGDLVGKVVGPVLMEVNKPSLRQKEEMPAFSDQKSVGEYFKKRVDDERSWEQAKETIDALCAKAGKEVVASHPTRRNLFPNVASVAMEVSAHDPEGKFIRGKTDVVCARDERTYKQVAVEGQILGFSVPLQTLKGAIDSLPDGVKLSDIDTKKLNGQPVSLDDMLAYAAGFSQRGCKRTKDAINEKQGTKRPGVGI